MVIRFKRGSFERLPKNETLTFPIKEKGKRVADLH